MKTLIFIIAMLSAGITSAQKSQTVVIQTSAECGMCKDRIESKLNYVKGIKFADLDIDSKQLTVKFDTRKIQLIEIKNMVAALGYNADEVPANQEEVKKLPACCQPGGMKSEELHK